MSVLTWQGFCARHGEFSSIAGNRCPRCVTERVDAPSVINYPRPLKPKEQK